MNNWFKNESPMFLPNALSPLVPDILLLVSSGRIILFLLTERYLFCRCLLFLIACTYSQVYFVQATQRINKRCSHFYSAFPMLGDFLLPASNSCSRKGTEEIAEAATSTSSRELGIFQEEELTGGKKICPSWEQLLYKRLEKKIYCMDYLLDTKMNWQFPDLSINVG